MMTTITRSANLIAIPALLALVACGGARERASNNNSTSQARDAGAGGADDGGFTEGFTEYGRGDYAIFLSAPDPRRFCWYIEETVRICGGNGSPTRDDIYIDRCIDDETNCLARQPEDSETDTGACWTRISYENVSSGALYGDCARLDAYRAQLSSTQCLYHAHCPEGRRCMDYQCVCPPGADCGCFDCPPISPNRCEGDVLLVDRIGEGCDENDRCWIDTQRVDCAAAGGTCNASTGACEGGAGGGPDAGTDPGTDPDAGPSAPDAGCMCPPTAPPRCDGDTRVLTVCDPASCVVEEVATDCTASGEVCDPSTGACIEDVECRTASDCPPPSATPPGQCAEVRCESNECVQVVNPC